MNDLSTHPLASSIRPRVALLVDGDNMSHSHAGSLILKSCKHGALTIKRVYGNMALHPGWNQAPGFKVVHSGTGKNATDILLTVEAMALMLKAQADILIIASSDGDFSHLALHLTEDGHHVIGLGEDKAPDKFRKSCTSFDVVAPNVPALPKSSVVCSPSVPRNLAAAAKPLFMGKPDPVAQIDPLICQIRDHIASDPDGMRITLLSTRMSKSNAFQISQTPFGSWRKLLTAHPAHFTCDPVSPTARVHLKT